MRTWSALRCLSLAVLGLPAACACPSSEPYDGDYVDLDPPRSLEGIDFVEGEKGDPRLVGCADGQREGFADVIAHPRIAGCLAAWTGTMSLREEPTGHPCGDDLGICESPADACAEGWHICGVEGFKTDLETHTTPKDCSERAGPGKFVSAMSHGQTQVLCPPVSSATTEFPCFADGYCSEPVCCGQACAFGRCRDGVWPGETPISQGKAEGCGAATSARNGGIACCYDGEANPRDSLVDAGGQVSPSAGSTTG